MGGIRIGKLLGFEISIDWSWLFIFFRSPMLFSGRF